MNPLKGQKVVETTTPPRGLKQVTLSNSQVLAAALADVESLLSVELRGQIASNQHCYVNLPHPLTVHNFREAFVPLFEWGNDRIRGVEALFDAVMEEMKLEREAVDLKARANVIVREYRVGQYIPFHFDDLECSELVLGIILENKGEGNTGLAFRKGEDNVIQQYVVPEVCGTVFSLEGEARYSWTHGLLPCRGRRISITCRFYKQNVIDKWRRDMDALPEDEPLPQEEEAATTPANVNVTLCDGRNRSNKKAMVVPSASDKESIIALFKQKLRLKVSKVALDKGDDDWRTLQNGDVIIGFK